MIMGLTLLNISCKLYSSYHPQIDGHIECTNETLEQYLCCFITYQQDDWTTILHFAKFEYNNSMHSTSKVMPFFAYSGYHPRWSFLELPRVCTNPSVEDQL